MTRGKIGYFSIAFGVVAIAAYFVYPVVQARASWYYAGGKYDTRNLLVTCEADTPTFRTTGFDFGVISKEPIFSWLEVYLACRTRDRLLNEGRFEETGRFTGWNSALTDVVGRAGECLSSRDLPSESISRCRDAHFNAIDWLLSQGIDINGGELGTILHSPIHDLDEEMFSFLLTRGADPHFRPPSSPMYAEADSRLKELVDTEPKSAIELIELQLANLNESEFPNVIAALQRMLKVANQR